ncbi:MAG: GtrA family protein [Candidatus Peribacteraceae bacterium]|nr:GtrA family protein [Candidatus Peribacteraceae bacterium]MDD5074782.1 GtrA family protein [Candidatus Peribacteraceae bacterium]
MSRTLFLHLIKFSLYVLSGCAAAVADLGSYFLLLALGEWYIAASVVSGVVGFFTAFLLNKYVVFRKRQKFVNHLGRYFIVDMANLAIITGILYLLVDKGGMDPRPAKFVALAPMVLWNYFVYKFAVYV